MAMTGPFDDYLPRKAFQLASAPRMGGWIGTYTGRKYWPLDPRKEDIDIQDIAHSLSKMCRYGGQCHGHMSVAEHSVHVLRTVQRDPEVLALPRAVQKIVWVQAFGHDFTEGYVVDVPRPLKHDLIGYEKIEHRNWVVIADWLGVPVKMHPAVKRADNAVLMAERAVVMPHAPDWAPELMALEPADVEILALERIPAFTLFMQTWWELTQ